MIRVTARVHPFAPAQREVREFAAGSTIQDIVTALVPVEVGRVIVMVDGEECTDRETVPADESLVTVSVVPAGSADEIGEAGQKTMGWGLVLGIGLFVASLVVGIGWIAWAGVGVMGVGGLVGGSLALASKIMKDLTATGQSAESTLSIAGGRNTAAPWGKVPIVVGKHRLTPHYAAGWYTYIDGTDGENQYLRQIFCLGRNTLKVSDIKLGENLMASNSADVRNGLVAIDGVYSDVSMELYQDGTAPTLFESLVTQDEIGAALTYNNAVWRTSAKNTTELVAAINVAGLYKVENGDRVNHTVVVEARYRVAGSGTAWASCPVLGTLNITRARAKLLRYELTATVAEGQYEVGLMRTSADDPEDFDGASETTWAALRSHRNIPVVSESMRSKVVLLAVAIKATDQLNGAIDNLNCICESVEHVYSGSNWTSTAVSRNPASHLIEGLVHGRFLNDPIPSASIDWSAFASWYTLCVSKGWNCDKVLADSATLQDLCNRIAHTGRAYITLRDGLYSVVVDEAKTTPVQHFTPRNVRSFTWTKAFADLPHGFRIGFLSADDDYQTSERLCLYDEYTEATATKLERLDLWGITDAAQVWKHGRYLLACRRLRPEAYTFETDVEGIVCEPGDLVLVSHDSIAVGIVSGRIKALTADGGGAVVAVEIDEEIEVEAGVTYGVQIRAVGGYYYRTVTVDGRDLTLSSSIPAGVLETGDLYTIGEAGTETMRCVVSSIEAGQDFGCRITCLDEAPGVHTADSGTIPTYTPLIGRKGQDTAIDTDIDSQLVDLRGQITDRPTSSTLSTAPATLASLTARAVQDGITLLAAPGGSPGLANQVAYYRYQLSPDGTTWGDTVEGAAQAAINFDRAVHGYPSAAGLASFRVRGKAVNSAGVESEGWLVATINTATYLGWTPTAPSAGIRASNRAITLGWQAQNDTCYGDLKYEIQVCKAIQADGSDTPADRELAASWRGPSSVDIYGLSATFEALLAGNDPADEGYTYRYGDKTDAWGGAAESVVSVTGSAYVHALPLDQEVVIVTRDTGDYLSTVALDTLYYYRIRAVSYDGETLVQSGPWCAEISAMAAASSALDVVRNMLNTATIVDGSIVAEKLFVEMLSAITANMGQITDGALVGNENNYWILTSGDYGGITRYAGDFRVGNELGDYFKCVWNPVTEKYEIDLKASSFRITAEGTEFDGEMIVTAADDPNRRCRVTSAGLVWELYTGGAWVVTGEVSQDPLGNITLTNDPDNAPTPLIEPPSVDSVYYHFDSDMLDQNGENGADITATGTLATPGIVRGGYISGSVTKEVSEYINVVLSEITLSNSDRLTCAIDNGVLYMLADGTIMERYDIATETMLSEITLSNRLRQTCAIDNGVLYIPTLGTIMERYDIATGTMLSEITLSNRLRQTCAIDNGVLYMPASSTIMERYDIATETMLSEITLSPTNRNRSTCAIDNGIVYIPIYNSTVMERYDIATGTMLSEITLSPTNRERYTCAIDNGIVYIPIYNSTVMERYDIATGTMLSEITLSSTNRLRLTCIIDNGVLYMPADGTIMERYGIATETMLSEITLSSTNRNRLTCAIDNGVLYIPNYNSTTMERYDTYYTHTLTTSFDLFAAWHKGALTLPGGITVPTNGSWQYIVLTADEATNTITWAVYNLDGSEYGTGSHEYSREVTGDIDITFTGHTDELVYDEDTALTEAKLTEVLEYRLPWGDGLDASKTWLVVHAKDPESVRSNAFLTRHPSTYETLPVADSTDKQLVLDATDGSWKLAEIGEVGITYIDHSTYAIERSRLGAIVVFEAGCTQGTVYSVITGLLGTTGEMGCSGRYETSNIGILFMTSTTVTMNNILNTVTRITCTKDSATTIPKRIIIQFPV